VVVFFGGAYILTKSNQSVRRGRLWAFKNRITHICGKAVADQTVISVGIDFSVNAHDPARWWDEIAPDLLAQAALDLYGGNQPYAAIVVDEAQDFSPNWWDALDYLWDSKGPIWAFLDKAQSLRRELIEPPIEGAFHFALDVNCRNTRRIVACANAAANVASEAFELAPLGRPPKMIVPPNPTAISGLVQAEVRTLIKDHRLEPRQIAIIGPASKAKGPLSNVTNIDNIPIVEDATSWREGMRAKKRRSAPPRKAPSAASPAGIGVSSPVISVSRLPLRRRNSRERPSASIIAPTRRLP
jgi:hypothetical protein